MSRIRLEFQAGEGVDLADITCYLIGLKNNGTFNPKTGETTVSEDPVTDKDDIYWDKIGDLLINVLCGKCEWGLFR